MDIGREQIARTDDEIEAAFEGLGYGVVVVDDLTFGPSSDIDDFRRDRRGWLRPGVVTEDSPDAFVVTRAAATKGQARRDVVLVRLGAHCAIYGLDK